MGEVEEVVIENEINIADHNSSDLMSLLDSEINQIYQEQKRPGWTVWALYIAISTVIWTIIQQASSAQIPTTSLIIKLYISFFVLIDILQMLNSFLNNNNSMVNGTRYRQTSLLQYGRSFILYKLCLYTMIAYLYYVIKSDVGYYRLGYTYILFMICGLMIVLVMSYINLPLSTNNGRSNTYISLIVSCLAAITIYFCSNSIDIKLDVNYMNLKISLLLIALTHLLGYLVSNPQINPYLATLTEIRRQIALKQVDIISAIKQIDIALYGLKTTDIFSAQFTEIINDIIETNKAYQKAIKKIKSIKSEILDSSSDITEAKKEICITAIDKLMEDVRSETTKLKIIMDKVLKLKSKANWMVRLKIVNQDMVDELSNFITKITKHTDEVFASNEEYMKNMAAVCKDVCDNKCKSIEKYL